MSKITRFRDIPMFPSIYYSANVDLGSLKVRLEQFQESRDGLSTLDMNPDFQRGHVWTPEQQTRFMEFFLRGGESGRHIYFNHPGWMGSFEGEFVLVDGLQRLTAALAFLDGKVPVFGSLYHEFEDHPSLTQCSFIFNVSKLQTRAEVLRWYLDFNAGGTPHASSEIDRVRGLLEAEVSIAKAEGSNA